MDIKVISQTTGKASKHSCAYGIFDKDFNMPLVHQVVIADQAALRSGTKAQKNRSAVKGGGAKPWRQKGTGRARAGTSRSPIWRTGGVTFAAKPRSYVQKVNRKAYQAAMRSLVSELIRNGTMVICDDFSITERKTKQVVDKLKKFKLDEALVILDAFNEDLYFASRNLYSVGTVDAQTVSSYQLLQYKNVIISKAAIAILEERLSK